MSQVVNLNDPKVGYVSERDHSKRQFYPVFSITLRLLIRMELFLKLFMHTSFISLVGLPTLLHTEISQNPGTEFQLFLSFISL